MQKKLISLAIAGAFLAPLAAFAEDAPASPFAFNVGVVSDYLFRGVSQTHGGGALQGGVDYTHPSGFYAGAWGSTITWVEDWLGSGNTEIDVYAGYKGSITEDLGYDVGLITYNYPGHGNLSPGALADPDTKEVYAGLSWKWLSAKYSYALTPYFIGWYGGTAYDKKTTGSNYLEFNANYDMGDGWTLVGHYGKQKVKNSVAVGAMNSADYSDWKIGVTKDVGLGVVGLAYSDTNTKGSCNATTGSTTNPYCWGTGGRGATLTAPGNNFKDVSKGTVVVTFTKSF